MEKMRTKIICTIGPACHSDEKLKALISAGMNVARFNFSHGSRENHEIVIKRLHSLREELDVPLAIMIDTTGPEIRIGEIEGGSVTLPKGHRWRLVSQTIIGNHEAVSISPKNIIRQLTVGTKLLIDDGAFSTTVVEVAEEEIVVELHNEGTIGSRKGVNIPNVALDLPALTEKDRLDIKLGCDMGVEYIALSFVRSPDNVIEVKKYLESLGAGAIWVLAKIENHEGVENFEQILQVSDGVMIARGDLGVEIPLSRVPILQKEMIKKCYIAGKPSITATQMLDSMMNNARPTRAEVSDIANAIYDSTSAVMLSGETSIGKYPIEAVNVMKSVIQEAESAIDFHVYFDFHQKFIYNDVPSSVTLACVQTAYSSRAKALIAFTSGGTAARLLSRLRPEMPIIVMTSNRITYYQLAINWGVIPYFGEKSDDFLSSFKECSQFALDRSIVEYGDLVVVSRGSTFGISGTTNMMLVEHIGNVLVRGFLGRGKRIYANIKILLSIENIPVYSVRGQLIILPKCGEEYIPYIEEAAGVILENTLDDLVSETWLMEYAEEHDISVVIRADAASKILHEGQLVTLDPEKALIYKGVVL